MTAGFGLASGSVAISWGRGSGSVRARGGAGGGLGSAGSDGGPRAMAERGVGPKAETWRGRVKEDDPDRWAPPVSGRSGDGVASGWRRRRAAELGRAEKKGKGEGNGPARLKVEEKSFLFS